MVDSLRSGGFSTPTLGYGTRGSGFSQYRIGNDDGENIAYLEKLSAQTAWQNGQITDEQYLDALAEYVDALEEGSSQYISAVNQLEDARWNIGRNKLVINLNEAGTTRQRVAALNALIAYDRRWRATMVEGNEQYREITARISDLQQQSRAARWSEMVDRYNADKVSDARMLAFAKLLVREAGGSPDAATYRGYVDQFGDNILDDQLQDAIDAWEQSERPSPGLAQRVEELYRRRMATMAKDSPARERYAEALESFQRNVDARKRQYDYERASSAHDNGHMSDRDWLAFLNRRVRETKPGTVERIRARDAFLAESFRIASEKLEQQVADGDRDRGDLIDFYVSSLAVLNPDSARARAIQARIEELRTQAAEPVDISRSQGKQKKPPKLGGHWVLPSGRGTKDGYISQHDGSAFASKNCGMASAAMLAWDVTGGSLKVTGGELRYYSGDREGGTWTDDVVTALNVVGLGARAYHGMTLSTFRKRIANGKPALLTGTNAMLPSGMRFGYDGDHSVFVARVRVKGNQTFYWVMDPNGPKGYTGAWWTEEQLYAFGWQGSYQGSVVFAGKSGNEKSRLGANNLPPIQRFDTDWNGRSTLGRGGGASRAEAGPRQDWSKGKKAWKLQKKAGGKQAVEDFLGVVGSLEQNMSPERRAEIAGSALEAKDADEQQRANRAARILARNENDPRRAVVEWFTGATPAKDPATWTKGQRWYSNAASRKLDMERIGAGPGINEPGGSGQQADVAVDAEPAPTGLDPKLEQVSRKLLRQLGVKPTPTNTKLMAAWLRTQNGDEIAGNNPLALRAPGNEDMAGQYGRTEDGLALFESMQDGIAAAAAEIKEWMPHLPAALRGNDPTTALGIIESSGWSEDPGYSGAITQTYNQLPGDKPVIYRGGLSPYSAPVSMASTVRQQPELMDLFEVDPSDPVQLDWFQANVERAKEAISRGQSTFMFLPPGATEGSGDMQVPISIAAVKDLAYMDYGYAVELLPPTPDRPVAVQALWDEFVAYSDEVDLEAFQKHYDRMMTDHDLALQRGDLTTAYNIELDLVRNVNAALGIGPDEDPDMSKLNRDLTDEQYSWLASTIDRMQPRAVDPNHPEEYAPNGSPLLQLARSGDLHVENAVVHTYGQGSRGPLYPGTAARVTADPGVMFHSQRPDGALDTFTRLSHPELFTEVTVPVVSVDPETGEPTAEQTVIPRYQSFEESGLLPVQTDRGLTYQPVEPREAPFISLYVMDYSGRSRELDIQQHTAAPAQPPPRAEGQFLTDELLNRWGVTEQGVDEYPPVRAVPSLAEGYARRLEKPLVPDEMGIPVFEITTYDPESQEVVTWLSIDQLSWVGWMGEKYGQQPPALVAMNGATWKVDDSGAQVLMVGNQPYDAEKMGSVSLYLGWYGAPGTPGPRDGTGAPNADYLLKGAVVGQAPVEGQPGSLTVDLTITPMDRAKLGSISYREAVVQELGPEGLDLARTFDIETVAAEEKAAAHAPVPKVPSTAATRSMERITSPPGGAEAWATASEGMIEARVQARQAQAQAEADRVAAAKAQAELEARQAEAAAARAEAKAKAVPTVTPKKPSSSTGVPAPKQKVSPSPAPSPAPAPSEPKTETKTKTKTKTEPSVPKPYKAPPKAEEGAYNVPTEPPPVNLDITKPRGGGYTPR